MGRILCAVAGCSSAKTPLSSNSFYKIYTRNRDVHAWTRFCHNSSVNKNSQICSKHFENSNFVNPNNKSQGLVRSAVPSLSPAILADDKIHWPTSPTGVDMAHIEHDEPMDVEYEVFGDDMEVAGEVEIDQFTHEDVISLKSTQVLKKQYTHIDNDHDYDGEVGKIIGAMERLVIVEEENIELKKKVRKNQKHISKQKIKIRNLESEISRLKRLLATQSTSLADPILVELQRNKGRKLRGARYSNEMKNMAIILHYCSNKAYKQMRKYFTLPSISTIRGWLSKLEVKEGYSKVILQLLRLRVAGLSEDEKLVTIVIDEMSVAQRLTYVANARTDYFMGFPTKVGKEDVNIQQRANNALTIMIKSIKSGFKQAIGFFFNASTANTTRLQAVVNQGIKLVAATGLIPKMIVCDQNSTNRSLFKSFGITEECPWFMYKKKKIYCAFDAPHLVKSSRNNLLRHNAVFDGQICSFRHIEDLYHEDVKKLPRTVKNLTYDHIHLAPYAEMNVGKATQTLSESVSVGLKAYVQTGKLLPSCLNTANYCESFDKLFDCANSISFHETKDLKRPLFEDSPHWEFLASMKERLKSLRFISNQCFDLEMEDEYPKLPTQSRQPYFIEGWIEYISAIQQLWKELRTVYGFAFLRTRNLSQDCLEHFFSIIRWKNSNNNHPDASKFASAYKSIVINQLIAPKKLGNVQADISKYFVNTGEMSKVKLITKPAPKLRRTHVSGKRITNDENIDLNQLNSIHYTTGWLCSRLKHRECIERCLADAEDAPNESLFLIKLKKYKSDSKLCIPGMKMLQFCRKIVSIFEKSFESLLKRSTYGVKRALMETIFWPCRHDSDEELVYNILCLPCAKIAANKYINMLIKAKLQLMNMNIKSTDQLKRRNKKVLVKRKKLNIK